MWFWWLILAICASGGIWKFLKIQVEVYLFFIGVLFLMAAWVLGPEKTWQFIIGFIAEVHF
jgi:hypothetical protein